MIRIDALWLATAPLDMRAGPDKALGRVVEVFGAARLHHAYLFANQRGTRMKVLVHDGQGLWLLARRLHQGRFVWPQGEPAQHIELNRTQWEALIMGLPWQRLGADGAIRVV
jgi:transposase